MKPLFSTERFDVFHLHCERSNEHFRPRDVYVALHHAEDTHAVVCTVTIWNTVDVGLGNFVEWMEVREQDRRQGIATEVLRGIYKSIGELSMEGATEAGEAFVERFYELVTD